MDGPSYRAFANSPNKARTLKGIAVRKEVDNSYVSRMVNLTTLAPDIVEAIMNESLPDHITLLDPAVDQSRFRKQ